MEKDDAASPDRLVPANDNGPDDDGVHADIALTRIAEAIGRHIAREHIRARRAVNDNEMPEDLPPAAP